jgi:serine/threonine protein kinase
MATLEDRTILEKSAQDEYEHPLPQGTRDDRSIYLSRNQFGQPSNIARVLGRVVITDFGFSVQGDGPHFGPISAESLRAPEVVLDAGWSYPADIWSLGVMVRNPSSILPVPYLSICRFGTYSKRNPCFRS